MSAVKAKTFTGHGGREHFALVLKEGEDTKLDLLVFDNETGAPGIFKDVPRGQQGEGITWHDRD